jgi:hypothetical protein
MGSVRPLVVDDIPQVARLYAAVFGPLPAESRDALQSACHEIFLGHPWRDDDLPSLVYEDRTRGIVGCLGVMPRPMSMDGRPIRAAITHTVMVHPASRSTSAFVDLASAYLSGPQDVSMAQGTGVGRRIFEAFGGSASLLYSLGWTRILRPGRYALSFLTRHGVPAVFAPALTPVCSLADAMTVRFLRTPFRLPPPKVSGVELDADTLWRCLAEFSHDRTLRPTYDAASSKWLLALLARRNGHATLANIAVRDSSGEVLGYYLYYMNPAKTGEVVQIAARPESINEVVQHLFYHAWSHGLTAVSGQLDPVYLPALGAQSCVFNRGDGSWLLVHSKYPDVLMALHRGDAFLTRLEGEWFISSALMRSLGRA